MRRRLVVTVLLDEGGHEELDWHLAGLVCSTGVAAWQVGESETFCHESSGGPVDSAVRDLDLAGAR